MKNWLGNRLLGFLKFGKVDKERPKGWPAAERRVKHQIQKYLEVIN